ncbi:unnamed protein product [Protopolystoma xenopodis]|uniref:Uncharacterized protein n=1 Tax=Protopolystoma xenopodis TaxID=117903 RepID=A0A448XFW9_9PLAT|nr:unnamed protein product [Protopolystoma xenopodis]
MQQLRPDKIDSLQIEVNDTGQTSHASSLAKDQSSCALIRADPLAHKNLKFADRESRHFQLPIELQLNLKRTITSESSEASTSRQLLRPPEYTTNTGNFWETPQLGMTSKEPLPKIESSLPLMQSVDCTGYDSNDVNSNKTESSRAKRSEYSSSAEFGSDEEEELEQKGATTLTHSGQRVSKSADTSVGGYEEDFVDIDTSEEELQTRMDEKLDFVDIDTSEEELQTRMDEKLVSAYLT